MTKTVFAPALLAVFALLALAGCSRPTPPAEPVRAVKVLTVSTDNLALGQAYSGEVRARVESRLGFRVGGKMVRRAVEVGQRVQAGQLLAQLDPRDYQLAVDAARAQTNAARTNRDLADAEYKRYKALKDQNFISGAELERREASLKAAQAQLEQAQSQQAVQGNQADYAALVADVSGVVTAVEAEAGQVVAAGVPVVRIAADGPRDVVFSVPEDQVTSLKPGQAARVQAWAQPGQWTGKVREVGASADPQTRTFTVKLALDSPSPLPLGATVNVALPGLGGLRGVAAIKLPSSALRQEGSGSAVWVLEPASMTVRLQSVQVATVDGNEVVIGGGLQPGMLVVSAGVHVLSPGQKVTVYQALGEKAVLPPAAPAAPAPAAPAAAK